MNVGWQMEGVDIHVDVNVGKQLSALGHTLTMLTGTEQDDDTATIESDSDETDHTDGQRPSETTSRVVSCVSWDQWLINVLFIAVL